MLNFTPDQIESFAGAGRDYETTALQSSAAGTRASRQPRIKYNEARSVPVPSAEDVVALPSTTPESRKTIAIDGCYAQVTSKSRRVWLRASHISFVEEGVTSPAYPIRSRTLVGSSEAIASNPSQFGWVLNNPDLLEYLTPPGMWDEPTTIFQLDISAAVPLRLPTGYSTGGKRRSTGLPGLLHQKLTDLQAREAAGLPLLGMSAL